MIATLTVWAVVSQADATGAFVAPVAKPDASGRVRIEPLVVVNTPVRLSEANVRRNAHPANDLVVLLRGGTLVAEWSLSADESAKLALLASELTARDAALEKLYRKDDQTEFEKAAKARHAEDDALLAEALGSARGPRVRQIVRHYHGAFRTLRDDKVAAKTVGITFERCFEIYEAVTANVKITKIAANQRFIDRMTATQRERWLRLTGDQPKQPPPKDWPHGLF